MPADEKQEQDLTCCRCGDPRCDSDADGWCPAHGWDCADFHIYLDDEAACVPTDATSSSSSTPGEMTMTTPNQWVAQFMSADPDHAEMVDMLAGSTDWEDFCWIVDEILKSDAVVEAGLPPEQVDLSRVVDSSMVIDSLYLDLHAATIGAYLMVFIGAEDIGAARYETTGQDTAVAYAEVVMTKLAELSTAYRACTNSLERALPGLAVAGVPDRSGGRCAAPPRRGQG